MTRSEHGAQKAKVQTYAGKALASIMKPMDTQSSPSATKIIFTIGPKCQDVETLSNILRSGGTCARIDLTWGSLPFHQQSLRNLEQAMLKTKCLCAVMVDTLGREIYVHRDYTLGADNWPTHASPVLIKTGQEITLDMDKNAQQTETIFPVNYSGLSDMVEPGDSLYMGRYLVTGADEASLYLKVKSKDSGQVKCTAQNDANLDGLLTIFHMERDDKSISNMQNTQPLFSDLDLSSLKALATEFDIDFLSLSYTRGAEDVHKAREVLNDLSLDSCRIIAKLDAKQSLVNFRGILANADGIMLSRGNLGLDCLPEKVAVIQKNVTTSCNLVGKPCIVTRIVDTMVNAPRPTRAEATDVANAVLDGADCLMLGAETLRGLDPANAVKTVMQCCQAAEAEFNHPAHFDYLMREAMRAEEAGIMVPGGADLENTWSPDNSSHGTGEAFQVLNSSNGSGNGHTTAVQPSASAALKASSSHAVLATTLKAMTRQAPSSANLFSALGGLSSAANLQAAGEEAAGRIQMSFLSKLEAIASSSVRVAEKAAAKIIIVFTDTGLTAALVAKYRPTVPILTLVIPRLVNQNMQWKIIGRHVARQCLLTRGLVPMLAAPSPDGERVLRDAVTMAAERGLVGPGDHAVCVEKISGDYCIKMVTVDDSGKKVKEFEPLDGGEGLVHTVTMTPGAAW